MKVVELIQVFLKWIATNSSLAMVLVTGCLVLVTAFYLIETGKLRKIAEKNFLYEHNPSVYVSKLSPKIEARLDDNALSVLSTVAFKNVGRTEARNLRTTYSLISGENDSDGTIIDDAVIYPGQTIGYQFRFGINLSDAQVDLLRRAQRENLKLRFEKGFLTEDVTLEISVSYNDLDGHPTSRRFNFKYEITSNEWVIPK